MARHDCLFLHARPTLAADGTRVYPLKVAARVQELAAQGYGAATELARYCAGGHTDARDVLLWLWKGQPGAQQSDA